MILGWSRSLSTTYEMGKPWDKHLRTAHLNCLVSNLLQQHYVQEPCRHFYACTKCYKRKLPCYEHDCPCYERHTPVMSITPLLWVARPCYEHPAPVMIVTSLLWVWRLLWACGAWLLQIAHVQCLSCYGFPSNKLYNWLSESSSGRAAVIVNFDQ